jgi:hypothetical protein
LGGAGDAYAVASIGPSVYSATHAACGRRRSRVSSLPVWCAGHAGRSSTSHCGACGALLTLHCGIQLAGFSVRGESPVYHPTCLGVPSGQSESRPAVEHTLASAV